MIHVKENLLDKNTVNIDVSGVLDQTTVPVLKEVCDRHNDKAQLILVNLEGVIHVTREGRRFLQGLNRRINIINLPEFIEMEKGL